MSKIYKVWVEIEEIDEEKDTYETIEGYMVERFDNEKEAKAHAIKLACVKQDVPGEKE